MINYGYSDNYLIITLGTRDVQINKTLLSENKWIEVQPINKSKPLGEIKHTINETYINVKFDARFVNDLQLQSPRNEGKIIIDNFESVEPIITIPIIEKTLEKLKTENTQIDKIILIYTDQKETNENKEYFKSDTIHFLAIIQRILIKRYGFIEENIDEFGISENLTDIDFQYNYFGSEDSLQDMIWGLKETINKVYLLPQGGIGQINYALTLRLIEYFKDKLILFQQSESDSEPKVASFPILFLNNIKKNKIDELLKNYEFGLIDDELLGVEIKEDAVLKYRIIKHLALYASKRLSLQHKSLDISFLTNNNIQLNIPKSKEDKLLDLFFSAKINLLQKKGNEFLWKIFTLGENLFKLKIELELNFDSKTEFNKNTDQLDRYEKDAKVKANYHNFLKQKLQSEYASLCFFLRAKKTGFYREFECKMENPSRWENFFIYYYLKKLDIDSVEKKVFESLEILAFSRNGLAHEMDSISINEIDNKLGENYNSALLLKDIEQILKVENYGIYDQIKDEIKKLL